MRFLEMLIMGQEEKGAFGHKAPLLCHVYDVLLLHKRPQPTLLGANKSLDRFLASELPQLSAAYF